MMPVDSFGSDGLTPESSWSATERAFLMMLCTTFEWYPMWTGRFYAQHLSGLLEIGMNGGQEMLSCNAGIAEMTDKAAVPAAEHREVAADSAYNYEISRPAVARTSRIARNDRK
jgi:hypothetical protein